MDVTRKCTAKNRQNWVDAHPFPASLVVPREAGLLHFGVCSTYVGDCKLAQFCPGLSRRRPGRRRRDRMQDWVFLSFGMYGNGWFFDIYIQGSKKIQL